MCEPINLAPIRARADAAVDEARTWREVMSGLAESGMDVPALLAEIERLYGLLQDGGDWREWAEANVAEVAWQKGENARLRAENSLLREQIVALSTEEALEADYERMHTCRAILEQHEPADCPVCRHALGLPTLAEVLGEPRIGPVAENGPGLAHGDPAQARDALYAAWRMSTPIDLAAVYPTAEDAREGQS